eukprot:3704489-Pyramimonas_sp.AAC.1
MKAVVEFKLSSFDEQAAVFARALCYVYTDEGLDLPTGSLDLSGMGDPDALPADAGNSIICEDQDGCNDQRAEKEGRLELEVTVGKVLGGLDASPVVAWSGWSGRAPSANVTSRLNGKRKLGAMSGSHLHDKPTLRAVVVKPVRLEPAEGVVSAHYNSRAERELGRLFTAKFGQKKYKPLVLLKYVSQNAPSGIPKVLYLLTVKENGLAYYCTKNPAQSPSIRWLATAKSVKGERMTANIMLSRIQLLLTPSKCFCPLGVSGVDAWWDTELDRLNAVGVDPNDGQARCSLTFMRDL